MWQCKRLDHSETVSEFCVYIIGTIYGNFGRGWSLKMVEHMEEIEVEIISCDEQANTTTSTSDNETGDRVYAVPKKNRCWVDYIISVQICRC